MRAKFVALREALATAWPLALIVCIGFVIAFRFVQPAPPKKVVISSGSEAGAYFGFANRYAAYLKKQGIQLEVRTSGGSVDNLARLQKGEVDIGFVQGGVWQPEQAGEGESQETALLSLGSMYYEPFWVFYRGAPVERLADLSGKRIAIGSEGSGLRKVALELLGANGVPPDRLLPLSGTAAVEALHLGKVDAVCLIAGPEAPSVQALWKEAGVQLLHFGQAEAYVRRFGYLSRLTLPAGSIDLVRNIPSRDTELLAPAANLVVRADLHPAVISLLLQAARDVHGKAGFFQKAGEFPALKDQALPISEDAERFYKSGPPFLQRFLPFWLAVLVDRLLVLIVPIVVLLMPLLKLAPVVYSWRIKSRIFRCYGALKFLDNELQTHFQRDKLGKYREELDRIEQEANSLSIPLSFTDLLYTLREHINLVRQRLDGLATA
ncbi:MAG: hypothetical protein RIR00_1207 [Pseudomonadota bacterium]|jgi:TRAP transporter TAXI family solute receptor